MRRHFNRGLQMVQTEQITTALHQKNKKQAYKFVVFQLILTFFIAAFFSYFGVNEAKSALKGGLIAVIANVVFVFLSFKVDAAQNQEMARQMMQKAVSLKTMISILLFAAVLTGSAIEAAPFLLTYALVVMLQFCTAFFFKH